MTFLTSWLKSCLNMTVFLLLGILTFMCVVLISQCQRAFLNLIDSFNLVQSVSGPTQKHRHTLDLVLSYGLPFFNQEICDAVFSDHIPVLFEAALARNTVKPRAVALLTLPLLFSSWLLSIRTPSFLSLCAVQISLADGFSPPAKLF